MTPLSCTGLAIGVVGGMLLMTWVTQLLWNSVVVSLFHVSPIDYWLALGLYLLLGFIGNWFRAVRQ